MSIIGQRPILDSSSPGGVGNATVKMQETRWYAPDDRGIEFSERQAGPDDGVSAPAWRVSGEHPSMCRRQQQVHRNEVGDLSDV
jgi:hypothetical protein